MLPSRSQDPKSLLNELRHKIADLGLVYDTNPVPNRSSGNFFQSVLHVRFQSSMYTFAGEVARPPAGRGRHGFIATTHTGTGCGCLAGDWHRRDIKIGGCSSCLNFVVESFPDLLARS